MAQHSSELLMHEIDGADMAPQRVDLLIATPAFHSRVSGPVPGSSASSQRPLEGSQ